MGISCNICYSPLTPNDSIFVSGRCGHCFHSACLEEWMIRAKSCPQCRKKITKATKFQIYLSFDTETCSPEVAAQLIKRVEELTKEIVGKDTKIQTLQDDLQRLEVDSKKWAQEVDNLKEQLSEREKELANAGTKLTDLEKKLVELSLSEEVVKVEVATAQTPELEKDVCQQVLDTVVAQLKIMDIALKQQIGNSLVQEKLLIEAKQIESQLREQNEMLLGKIGEMDKALADADKEIKKVKRELLRLEVSNLPLSISLSSRNYSSLHELSRQSGNSREPNPLKYPQRIQGRVHDIPPLLPVKRESELEPEYWTRRNKMLRLESQAQFSSSRLAPLLPPPPPPPAIFNLNPFL